MSEKVSKKSVNYRPAESSKRCATCSMYRAKTMSCTLVRGMIRPEDVCDRWEKR